MRKENEFGGYYYQMNWDHDSLHLIRDLCLANVNEDIMDEYDHDLLYIADRIERELAN
jgi:hypothetical protein